MPKTSSSDRTKRHRLLLELLQAGFEGTQDEIAEHLTSHGVGATQATISRDLDGLGAVRRHEIGRIVYSLPERNGPPVEFGKRMLPELVLEVAVSANLVVVRTFPGMAATVAAVLDQSAVDGILGTVAGDDTVLVVADEQTGGTQVARQIEQLGAGS